MKPFSVQLPLWVAVACWVAFAGAPAPVHAQAAPAVAATSACPALLNRTQPRLQDEAPQNLCQYSGKVLLVVNTASYCGFTKQYAGLEALHAKYGARGFAVLGFPSNDFGAQEPKSNKEIADFCENTFNVKFPMFAKSVVKPGLPDQNPLFADLIRQSDSAPRWNFHKYLVGRDGKVVEAFGSVTAPDSKALVAALEKALEAKP
ncbi:glutathione peroxidase [Inhella crocodyli]|uniref:Glutathione peroxidase n=1 Tax=Inhella crocodyli TaxID=2499851 RepID=A0A3S2ULA3_9BURK|nr:glutathione peroxidase [Inhella crocodyli]RVT88874.1 glutathione peroxidase [Inhella crocodyli]